MTRPMTLRRYLPAPLAALVLLCAATAPLTAAEPAAAPAKVAVTAVEDLKAVFATVESVRQAKARTRIGGTIADLAVKEGDAVSAGQLLAMVRDPKLPLQQAAIDARLTSLEAQKRQAELELDRARSLRASGAGSQARLEDAQTALDVATAQIAAAKAERAVIEQQFKEGAVLAPDAGRVLSVHVVAGSVVMPGEPVATITTGTYVLRLRLPERHARFLKEGDPVLVGARGLGSRMTDGKDTLREGRVTLVYPELTQGQVVADAEVAGLGDFFVGERVRVFVATGTRDAMVVPDDYVFRRFGLEYVKLADGTEAVVQTGRPVPPLDGRPGGVEILSGLKPGDTIVKP